MVLPFGIGPAQDIAKKMAAYASHPVLLDLLQKGQEFQLYSSREFSAGVARDVWGPTSGPESIKIPHPQQNRTIAMEISRLITVPYLESLSASVLAEAPKASTLRDSLIGMQDAYRKMEAQMNTSELLAGFGDPLRGSGSLQAIWERTRPVLQGTLQAVEDKLKKAPPEEGVTITAEKKGLPGWFLAGAAAVGVWMFWIRR